MSLNRLWAALAIDTCILRGANHFFLAPGSRCTPLTLAVAQHAGCHVTQHFDERGLAYAALGYARATGAPGIFVCTSGTAVANAFPAVVEASNGGVPMLLLTADRPPELRDTGANQTIDQQRIFGSYVRWYFDMPCPTGEISPNFVRSQLAYAVEMAASGPVHLNFMLREPFAVSDHPVDLSAYPLRDETRQLVTGESGATPRTLPGGDTLVVVGGCRPGEAQAAAALARRLGAPLLGDITSGLRSIAYDLALLDAVPRPETVVHVGGRIVSKNWWQFIEQNPPSHWYHVTNSEHRLAPTHQQSQRLVGSIESICAELQLQQPCSDNFLVAWQMADRHCREVIEGTLSAGASLSEPRIAYALSQLIPTDHGLFLGNSMPVRDMDRYGFWPSDRNITVAANRGASGIDGVMASAAGFALGLHRPTTLLIGDLSGLHDLNSLALVKQASPPVIVVLVNNHGGGIFDLLPVAQQTAHYERFFATPHEFGFDDAAKMFDIAYHRTRNAKDFRSAYQSALNSRTSALIEVVTDREENRRVRAQIQQRVERRAGSLARRDS